MQKAIYKLVSFLLLTIPQFSEGQKSTTQDKIESAANLIGNIGGLFKKKKNKETQEASIGSVTTRMAGAIHPNAKYIDCDLLYPFSGGAAIIKKGLQFALIDSSGNFIVPYGQYMGISILNNYLGSGFFKAINKAANGAELEYIINASGKVVVNPQNYPAGKFTKSISADGKHVIITDFAIYTRGLSSDVDIIDQAGNVIKILLPKNARYSLDESVSDSMFVFWQEIDKRNICNLVNLTSLTVNKTEGFYNIDPFTNGRAVFSKVDPYNNTRYGVIDKQGKIIIEPTLQFKPKPFKYGYTIIANTDTWSESEEPAGGTFDWSVGEDKFINAIIDSAGQILYKGNNKVTPFIGPWSVNKRKRSTKRINGVDYTVDNSFLLNTSLQTISFTDFFKSIGINPIKLGNYERVELGHEDFGDQQLRIFLSFSKSGYPDLEGVYDYVEKKAFIGDFNYSSRSFQDIEKQVQALYKDPIAKLIYAVMNVSDNQGKKIFREGYMNSDGYFVLLKKESAFSGL